MPLDYILFVYFIQQIQITQFHDPEICGTVNGLGEDDFGLRSDHWMSIYVEFQGHRVALALMLKLLQLHAAAPRVTKDREGYLRQRVPSSEPKTKENSQPESEENTQEKEEKIFELQCVVTPALARNRALPPPPDHTLRSDTTLLVPSCEARYTHPASSLVSSEGLHEGEKYTIVQAIGYYGPAHMRPLSAVVTSACSSPQIAAGVRKETK
ncbi:hypothetical protein B0H13DRAFT_2531789 [Mycena leptocephala]|nr:hypothetical protein B0H13DRAFT_2531789 [Mycena leptocephala]